MTDMADQARKAIDAATDDFLQDPDNLLVFIGLVRVMVPQLADEIVRLRSELYDTQERLAADILGG